MATDGKLTYWMLTATLMLAYIASVVTLQAAFSILTGQEQPQIAVVVSTLAIALLLNFPRRRVQGFIDRRSRRRKLERSDPA